MSGYLAAARRTTPYTTNSSYCSWRGWLGITASKRNCWTHCIKSEEQISLWPVANAVQNNKTGQATSYTVWAADLATWLPRVDIIAFMRGPDSKPQMYPWDQVVQAAGEMLKPLDIYPLRYEVSCFPNEQQFAAMGKPGSYVDSRRTSVGRRRTRR